MLTSRQCSGASTTGRVAQGLGDSAAYRSHDHCTRSPLPALHKYSAQMCRRPFQLSALSRHCISISQAVPGSRRHRQKQCWHSLTTACAAPSSCSSPESSRPPSIYHRLRTAAAIVAVFAVWCCITANTQPSSVFASVTTALTDAGAPPAGIELQQQVMHDTRMLYTSSNDHDQHSDTF